MVKKKFSPRRIDSKISAIKGSMSPPQRYQSDDKVTLQGLGSPIASPRRAGGIPKAMEHKAMSLNPIPRISKKSSLNVFPSGLITGSLTLQ